MPRKFHKTSTTWKIYETIFLQKLCKDEQGNLIQLEMPSKGSAINLAQHLNTFNLKYQQEQGVPLEFSDYSVRPLQLSGPGTDISDPRTRGTLEGPEVWAIQVTQSYKHRPKANAMLTDLLQTLTDASSGTGTSISATLAPVGTDSGFTEAEAIQHQLDEDEKIKKLMDL